MASIIRGTTPTIKYSFSQVAVSDIVSAYLTIKDGKEGLERDITTATVGENDISWTLTQAETLALDAGPVIIMLNWKLADGTRGASSKTAATVVKNHKEVVI